MTTVLAGLVTAAGERAAPGWIAFDDGGILVEVGHGDAPAGAHPYDGCVLAPGFVDLQVNGLDGVDLASASPDAWADLACTLATHGVTSFLPTFVSAPLDQYDGMLAAAHAARANEPPGAASIAGVHLEGPFLGGAPGAHNAQCIRPADEDWLAQIVQRFPGLIRVVTLAPEADPDYRATHLLTKMGVIVALGHTTADFDEIGPAVSAGATLVTHLFNGMAPWHHRSPGLAGAALTDDRVAASIIADFVHVHPSTVLVAYRTKEALLLVSDSVGVSGGTTGGMPARFDGPGGAAVSAGGTLAGSSLTLDRAVTNVISLGVPLERALAMASTIPAHVAGLTDRGRLEPGLRADIVAVRASDAEVVASWVAGTPAARKPVGDPARHVP